MHGWPTLIKLKFDVLHHYPFLLTVSKLGGSFDTDDNTI